VSVEWLGLDKLLLQIIYVLYEYTKLPRKYALLSARILHTHWSTHVIPTAWSCYIHQ